MAIIRGPDGKPIQADNDQDDEATRKIERRSLRDKVASSGDDEDRPTQPRGGSGGDDVTGPVRRKGGSSGDDPKTRLVGTPGRASPKGDKDEKSDPTEKEAGMEDPVVGWVVIIDGPGKGRSLPLGYGMNSIGRAASERLCLDFGDTQISRTNHATITYDPRGRKFFVTHGGGKNLTYMGDNPVLAPVEIKGGEDISLGQTMLRFVPFCGDSFDWGAK